MPGGCQASLQHPSLSERPSSIAGSRGYCGGRRQQVRQGLSHGCVSVSCLHVSCPAHGSRICSHRAGVARCAMSSLRPGGTAQPPLRSSSNARSALQLHSTAAAASAGAAALPFPESTRHSAGISHQQQQRRSSSFGRDREDLLFRRLSPQPEPPQQHSAWQQQHQQQLFREHEQPSPGPQAFLAGQGAPGSSGAAAAAVVTTSTAAAVAGLPPGLSGNWHISSHIRHSVEEALKAGINMAVVHMPNTWQQGQQQEQQQQEQQQQQQPPACSPELQEAAEVFDQAAADTERITSSCQASTSAASSQQQQRGAQPAAAAAGGGAHPSTSSKKGAAPSLLTKQIQACGSAAELEQLLQQEWQQLDHIHAAAAFVQLARTQRKDSAAAQQHSSSPRSLAALLQELAAAQLPRMQARQVASVLWACGALGLRPEQPLLSRLVLRAEGFFAAGTSTQGFANIIWGLASIGECPDSAWLGSFFAASERHLPNFQPQELSSTLWALARLGVVPPESWLDSYLAASTAKMGSCSAQALSNQLWAAAKLGLPVNGPWLAAMQYACQIRASDFTPAGFANLLWAAGKVSGKQQQRPERWSGQQQLPVRATGVGASSSSSSLRWLEPLLAAALPQLQQQSAHALSNIIWSLAVLECRPSQAFVQACFSQLMAKASSLTAAGAACSLWGLSRLGLLPAPQQVAPLLQQLQQVLGHSSTQHLVYVAAALAHFRQLEQQQQKETAAHERQPQAQASSSGDTCSPHSSSASPGVCLLPDELQRHFLDVCCIRLPGCGPGQLVQLGRWLAAAGIQPEEAWTDAYLSAAAQQLHKLNPGHLAALLRLVGAWGVQPQPGWSAMFLAAVAAERAVRGYSADTVAALLQGCAAAGLEPLPQQLEVLLQRMVAGDAGMSATAAAGALQALCGLGFRPPESWLQHFWAAAGSCSALATADAAALAALAGALQAPQLQQLQVRPSRQWAAAYHAAVGAALPQLLPKQAAAVLAGLVAARRPPKQEQEQLLPQLMAVAGSGLGQLQLHEVVASWWCLVEFQVLPAAVPLQQAAEASLAQPPASLPEGWQQQQQPGQDEQQQRAARWRWQQQWQAHWLQRLLFSPGAEAGLHGLGSAALLQLSDCLGRLQQQVPGSWADAYVAAMTPHLSQLRTHELVSLVAALPVLGGSGRQPHLAASLLSALQPALAADSPQPLSPAQLSELLVSLQAAGTRPLEPWLDAYVAAVGARLSAFRGRQLIKVLTSLARLRFVPDASFLAAASGEAVEKLGSGVPPALLVDLLWALTALAVRPSGAWAAKFEGRLLEKGLERLDGQQLSRLGWCLAALQRKPGQLLMARYLAATQAQLHAMDARSLSDTLWACAMLDQTPSKSWLESFFCESRKQLHAFPSSMLVAALWSLALLQQRPPSDWMARCLGAISSSMEAAAAAAAAARPASSSSSTSVSGPLLLRKPVMQPAWSAGSPAASSSSSQQQQQQAPLGPQQLARLAWSLAALDCQVPAPFLQQLLHQSEAAVEGLDADSLGQLMWALDRLDETQEKRWVRRFAVAARARLLPQGPPGAVWGAGPQLMGLAGGSSRLPVRPAQAAAAGGGVFGRPLGARLQQTQTPWPLSSSSSSSSDGGRGSGSESIAAAAAAAGIVAQPDIAAGVSSVVGNSSKQQLIAKLRQLKSGSGRAA